MSDTAEVRELRFVVRTQGGSTSLRMLTTEPRAREFASQAVAEATAPTRVEVWDAERLLFRLGGCLRRRTEDAIGT